MLTGKQALNSANAAPAMEAAAVTPSNDDDLPGGICRALYIGTGGNLAVDTYSNQNIAFTGVLGGTILPLQVKRVRVTGTSALNLVALY